MAGMGKVGCDSQWSCHQVAIIIFLGAFPMISSAVVLSYKCFNFIRVLVLVLTLKIADSQNC